MSDSLNLLSKALLRIEGGGVPKLRYVDLITPYEEEEAPDENEIIERMKSKLRKVKNKETEDEPI